MPEIRYNPLLHRTAQLTVAATLLLIFMGGLVTSKQAGMSVPDWPNSYGYNMFTFPPSQWIGGIFYEHTHRLMGTVVGLLAIALTAIAWKTESRKWVRWLAISVLGAVIFQGVLGGLRVVLVKLDLAIVHACVAQAFFCLSALMAVVTSQWWIKTSQVNAPSAGGFIKLAAVCVVVIYLQLIIGATMRHYQAGLAIPDFPLSYGKLLPPTDDAGINIARSWWIMDPTHNPDLPFDTSYPYPTLSQIWLNFGHRIGALVVTALLIPLITSILRRQEDVKLRRPAMLLIGLLSLQITLGILTILWRKPADIASLHVAVGALTLMTTFVLLIRSMRLYSPLWRTQSRGFEPLMSSHPMAVPA